MPVLSPALGTTSNTTDDERIIEEVHCMECNTPISAIPSWYANVNVRFTCDVCRQKSSKVVAPVAELETPRTPLLDGEEPAIDELDDETEVDETEADSEEEI
jgi:hypothetical protein